ncbi:MAG: LysE family transporter [Alicyclobacillaceae bacterium]|nr:LysE family transporter [Alicyclobacillaceae bacterium]
MSTLSWFDVHHLSLSPFVGYILLGISLSAPIGPINAAQLDGGMRHGFFYAWCIGIGAMLADAAYMGLIFFGLTGFLAHTVVKSFLWAFGSVVLVYLGLQSLYSARSEIVFLTQEAASLSQALTSGFLMAISNPLNILFWFGIYGSLLAKTAETSGQRAQSFMETLGIFVGLATWDLWMAVLASSFRKWASPQVMRIVSVAAGAALIAFGLYFAFQAHRQIFSPALSLA